MDRPNLFQMLYRANCWTHSQSVSRKRFCCSNGSLGNLKNFQWKLFIGNGLVNCQNLWSGSWDSQLENFGYWTSFLTEKFWEPIDEGELPKSSRFGRTPPSSQSQGIRLVNGNLFISRRKALGCWLVSIQKDGDRHESSEKKLWRLVRSVPLTAWRNTFKSA